MLAGATGLVGGHVLRQLLADARCSAVVAPTRRALAATHAKLEAAVLDFEHLQAWAAAPVDAVICALGSTLRQAGSRDAFHRIDHDYPLALARNARAQGATIFVLNSAMGADTGSRFFYNRVKGELERDLQPLGFGSLVLVRPGLIGGARATPRTGERLAVRVLTALKPLLPARYRVNPAERIAAAMVQAALAPRPGVRVIDAAQLT